MAWVSRFAGVLPSVQTNSATPCCRPLRQETLTCLTLTCLPPNRKPASWRPCVPHDNTMSTRPWWPLVYQLLACVLATHLHHGGCVVPLGEHHEHQALLRHTTAQRLHLLGVPLLLLGCERRCAG